MDELDELLQIPAEEEKSRIMSFLENSVAGLSRNGVVFGLSGGWTQVWLPILFVNYSQKTRWH